MFKTVVHFFTALGAQFTDKRLARASAALSYYFTMSLFPTLICLYTMLGQNYAMLMRVLQFSRRFLADGTAQALERFIGYVAANHSDAMFVAGLLLMLTSASAAERILHDTIGELQGATRFRGFTELLLSLLFSLVFLGMIYFAILVMLTGREFIWFINRLIPFLDFSAAWDWIRFIVLFAFAFLFILLAYLAARKDSDYSTIPGALVATVLLVAFSVFFSYSISASVKYSLVYGSMVSIILLMFWLNSCCTVIFLGAAVNIVLRDMKLRSED